MKRDIISEPVISCVASDLADICKSDAWKSWNTLKAPWLRGVPGRGGGSVDEYTKMYISTFCKTHTCTLNPI